MGKKKHAKYTAEQVANWFLEHAVDPANNYFWADECMQFPMFKQRVNYLLFRAQGHYLSDTRGELLFSDDIIATKRGPVVPGLFDDKKNSYNIESYTPVAVGVFTAKDERFLRAVWESYGFHTGMMIADLEDVKPFVLMPSKKKCGNRKEVLSYEVIERLNVPVPFYKMSQQERYAIEFYHRHRSEIEASR
jgi:uncharacterized phage-associated protein